MPKHGNLLKIESTLTFLLAEVLQIDIFEIAKDVDISGYSIDSVKRLELLCLIEKKLGIDVSLDFFEEGDTIETMSTRIASLIHKDSVHNNENNNAVIKPQEKSLNRHRKVVMPEL